MTKLVNRAKMTTATTGTGTITLGSAVDGYQTFAAAGVADADVVRYVIEDGSSWEIGLGTYTASGTTLTRGSIESSNADNPINLTGNAVVYVSAAAADLQELVDFADNFVLPTADGTNGQVLTTNGSGTLTFSTISGYTDADVDTHLNTSTASSGEVLSWNGSDYDWIAAPAALTGQTDSASPFETSLGVGAGISSTGVDNTFIGWSAGILETTGQGHTFVGKEAGRRSSTGIRNTALGLEALYGNSVTSLSGNYNIGIGYQTGYDLSSGSNNFLGGFQAGYDLTTGSNNIAIGNGALDAATTGGRNIAIGQDAMGLGVATVASGDNVAIGYQAGNSLTTGVQNVAIGAQALFSRTVEPASESGETAVGYRSLYSMGASGFGNTAIGYDAGFSFTGNRLTAVGWKAARSITSNEGLTAIGAAAASTLTSGRETVAVGYGALDAGTTAIDNVVIGGLAGLAVTTGSRNVIVGRRAAWSGTNDLTTGSNNIIIGEQAAASSATVSNEITLGNSSITTLRCQVTTITSLSDARDKTDIQPLNAGLEFVEALNPVSFTWNMRDGGKVGVADTGFIAQDLQKAQADTGVTIPDLVYDVNPDKLEAGYGKLIPVLVQAIKDLSAKVDELEARLDTK